MTAFEQAVPVDALLPHPENPRRGDVELIRASIRENGWFGAVVAQQSTGYVLAGNHRLQAARLEGIEAVPVVWVDVGDDAARRILLADNRTGDMASYDRDSLASVLGALLQSEREVLGTGWARDEAEDWVHLARDMTEVPVSTSAPFVVDDPALLPDAPAPRGASITLQFSRDDRDEFMALVDLLLESWPDVPDAPGAVLRAVRESARNAKKSRGDDGPTG